MLSTSTSYASKFQSSYPCQDSVKTCISSGTRIVDGFEVYKDCWEYSYSKICNYPSKDNCGQYSHCYYVKDTKCILHDSLGNCANQEKEYSCKSWDYKEIDRLKHAKHLNTVDGAKQLVCTGMPCLDGNCFDKSYVIDDSLMESITYLHMLSKIHGMEKDYQLFTARHMHCSKKPTSYINCCAIQGEKGWGKNLGAHCSLEEQNLQNYRRKSLCIYIGKTQTGHRPFRITKHHYCCFANMLDKIIQLGARSQLGLNFGSGSSPSCRGLTVEELSKVDFSRIDFSEFHSHLATQLKLPNIGDIKSRTCNSFSQTIQGDDTARDEFSNKAANSKAGVNQNLREGDEYE